MEERFKYLECHWVAKGVPFTEEITAEEARSFTASVQVVEMEQCSVGVCPL